MANLRSEVPVNGRNEEIRGLILKKLYHIHSHGRGLKSLAIGIQELQRAMKEVGVTQAEVNASLDYLLQVDWVKEVTEKRGFTTPSGATKYSETKKYKISHRGIDKLEGASVYRREESFSRIDISTINGVTIVGNGNVVNSQFPHLSDVLGELETAVVASSAISNEDKLNTVSELHTIQAQLAKPKPDSGTIARAWAAVEKVVTAGEFAGLVAEAAPFITQIIAQVPALR